MTTHHILLERESGSHFWRYDHDGTRWFRHPMAADLRPHLKRIFTALSADDAPDFTFSSHRTGLSWLQPDALGMSEARDAITRVLAPIGALPGSDLWASVTFHGTATAIPGTKFVATRRKDEVEAYFTDALIDRLKEPACPLREELWSRKTWKIAKDIDPALFPPPRYQISQAELAEQAEQAKARLPMPNEACLKLRQSEAAARSTDEATPNVEPAQMTRDELVAGKAKAKRQKAAVRGKVEADKFNKKAAEAYAAKRIKQMQTAGKL